jgi:hypothetical protein
MNSFVNAAQSHSPCPDRADRPSDKPARRDATDGSGLLDRILNTPRIDHVVPRLRPVLLALIDECPALHAGIGASQDSRKLSVSASDFEFISENNQVASVREFMQSLPETLSR